MSLFLLWTKCDIFEVGADKWQMSSRKLFLFKWGWLVTFCTAEREQLVVQPLTYTMQTLFRHYFSKQRQIFRESATTLINVNLMISRRKTALLHLQTRCCHCSASFISYFYKKNVRWEHITYPSSEKWDSKNTWCKYRCAKSITEASDTKIQIDRYAFNLIS